MKLEDQVCSLELAKKLKELGTEQVSQFYWVEYLDPDEWLLRYIDYNHFETDRKIFIKKSPDAISAFTVAELGEMLPDSCYTQKDNAEINEVWLCHLDSIEAQRNCFIEDTEANARANMLIYLVEQGLMPK